MKDRPKIKNIFTDYATELTRYITRKFGDADNAEDIVQDAFHNFLRMDAPESIENPRAYLYQAAHNLALNRIRKQRHHEGYIASQALDDSDNLSPERHISGQKDLEALQEKLKELPENCRKAFIMSRIYAKSYLEISQELGVSVSSVEKYLIKALRFIRENIEGNDNDRCL